MKDKSSNNSSYVSEDYVVDFDASRLGPEIEVACPKCEKPLGTIRRDEGGDLLCTSCAELFRARVVDNTIELHSLRKVVLTEEPRGMTPGQVLNRPDLVEGPTVRNRIFMVVWAVILTAVMMAGLWLVQQYLVN